MLAKLIIDSFISYLIAARCLFKSDFGCILIVVSIISDESTENHCRLISLVVAVSLKYSKGASFSFASDWICSLSLSNAFWAYSLDTAYNDICVIR